METVYILTGSNLSDREKKLQQALCKIECIEGLEVVATSAIYASAAIDMSEADAPPFLNQVVKGEYQYTASELLNALESIELALGRTDKGKRRSRTIDLDILLFGDKIIETEQLSVPHRELTNRPFALVPLLQIDPDLIHPVTRTPIEEFLSERDRASVVIFKDHVARHV